MKTKDKICCAAFCAVLIALFSCTKSEPVITGAGGTGQLGVYTETHITESGNALWTISGSSVTITTNYYDKLSEGYEGLQVIMGNLGYARYELAPISSKNLDGYSGGYLNFSIKTASTVNYLVGIRSSNNTEAWVALTSSHYTADGEWHAVSIPLSSFSNINFADITGYFMISNASTTTVGELIYLDDIYWSTASVQSKLWDLVWSDEFSGPTIDSSNWGYDTGLGSPEGWGNGELENYTTTNAVISNSNLVIWCYYNGGGADGRGNYTSSRLLTKDKRYWLYGRIAARMKLDANGQGGWPAFWMLGTNITSAGWPLCGEIDIMEEGLGGSFTSVGGTLHWGTNWSTDHRYQGGTYSLPSGTFADDYHIFEVEWNSTTLTWRVDNTQFYSMSIPMASVYNPSFQKPFFIIVNLAVGGLETPYTGRKSPDTSKFPKRVYVDWVRVYQLQP